MKPVAAVAFVLVLVSCGSVTSDEPNIDMIRDRLNRNACRIQREDLIFEIGELEFVNNTTYSEIPLELLPESLDVCPVTLEPYQLLVDGNKRRIVCPSGHGRTDF